MTLSDDVREIPAHAIVPERADHLKLPFSHP